MTLPGAFVGVLIGSGNPVQAGAAQVLVLFGLLAAEAVAAVVTAELVAGTDHPAGPGPGVTAGVTTMLVAFAVTMRPMASQSTGARVSPRTTVPIAAATTGLTLMKMPNEVRGDPAQREEVGQERGRPTTAARGRCARQSGRGRRVREERGDPDPHVGERGQRSGRGRALHPGGPPADGPVDKMSPAQHSAASRPRPMPRRSVAPRGR